MILFWLRQIYGKAEFLNPGGSVKDRVAAKIVEEVSNIGCLNFILQIQRQVGSSLAAVALDDVGDFLVVTAKSNLENMQCRH